MERLDVQGEVAQSQGDYLNIVCRKINIAKFSLDQNLEHNP
jgi:hypothetical protein